MFAVFAENYGETILKHTWIYVSLHRDFQHSHHSLPSQQKQCPVSTATNQRGCCCARACILAKQCGCVSWVRSVFWEIRGKSFLVSVPAIVLSPWKSMPVVERQSLLSCVCLYWWEKHPPTDRLTVYLQGGSRIRKMLTYREHINSPAGCQTEQHFARHLIYV